jgi:hypothetical protein
MEPSLVGADSFLDLCVHAEAKEFTEEHMLFVLSCSECDVVISWKNMILMIKT